MENQYHLKWTTAKTHPKLFSVENLYGLRIMAPDDEEALKVKMDQYIKLSEDRAALTHEKIEFLVECQKQNAEAIGRLKRDTEDIINIYNNIQGASRVGVAVQNFLLWLAKFGVIGTGIAALIKLISKNFVD